MNKIILLSLLVAILASPTERTTNDLSCHVHNPTKKDCGYYGIHQKECEKKGCCWKEDSDSSIPWCFYGQDDTPTIQTTDGLSCEVDRKKRTECGYYGINKEKCEKRGCCWKVDEHNSVVPWCFKGVKIEEPILEEPKEPEKKEETKISISFDDDYDDE